MLFKEIVDGRTDARTDDGRRTPDIEGSQKLTKNMIYQKRIFFNFRGQFTPPTFPFLGIQITRRVYQE